MNHYKEESAKAQMEDISVQKIDIIDQTEVKSRKIFKRMKKILEMNITNGWIKQ